MSDQASPDLKRRSSGGPRWPTIAGVAIGLPLGLMGFFWFAMLLCGLAVAVAVWLDDRSSPEA